MTGYANFPAFVAAAAPLLALTGTELGVFVDAAGDTTYTATPLVVADYVSGLALTWPLTQTFGSPIVSTVAGGTAPFTVASSTVVANLNASLLLGNTWAVPGAIGTTTPNAGTFTTLVTTSPIGPASGGTGVANNAAATETRVGNFGLTWTLTGPTSLTLPTSGTLSALGNSTTGSGSVVLQTSPTLVTPNIGAATGSSLTITGQFISTASAGTAPLVVSSTTTVANLSAAYLGGATFAAPGAIGSGVPGSGSFTSLVTTSPIGAAYGGTGIANSPLNTVAYTGTFGLTWTLTATTALTLPTSGTLATQAYVQTYIGSSGAISWGAVSTSTALAASINTGYPIDTTSTTCTVTMPATPSVGNIFGTCDPAGTWGTNNVTFTAAGGIKILGQAVNFVGNVPRVSYIWLYTGSTYGWVVT